MPNTSGPTVVEFRVPGSVTARGTEDDVVGEAPRQLVRGVVAGDV